MAYLLTRTIIVLIAWGVTCGIIMNVWPHVDPMIYYVAAASWALAGLAYFSYVQKLRREAVSHRTGSFIAGRSRS
jgi:hypothetical protein